MPSYDIRTRNGPRELGSGGDLREEHGFHLIEAMDMPAKNFSAVFRKRT
jgi:hypothetical protein